MRPRLRIWGFCVALSVVPACEVTAEGPVGERPPSIVYILADDLGYGDLRCFNASGKIATPHLDRLAADGMRFTDAHSSSAVCTPTRYGILTGRYNWRSSLKSGVLGGYSKRLIETGRLMVPEYLRQSARVPSPESPRAASPHRSQSSRAHSLPRTWRRAVSGGVSSIRAYPLDRLL
jgi:Sulfatase